jgi:hypothetical protein
MSFLKLDEGILTSTLWLDRIGRAIFIAAGLKARPCVFREPVPVYAASSTGDPIYTLPPGEYGFTECSGPGLVMLAGHNPADPADWAEGMEALRRLTEADPDSRNPILEGRRLARVNGGYVVLNLMRYRAKDMTAAERKRRQRERDRDRDIRDVTRDVTEDRRQRAEGRERTEQGGGGRPKGNGGNGAATAREMGRLEADPVLAGIADTWAEAFHRPGRQLGVLRAARTALAGGYAPDAMKLVIRVVAVASEEPERFADRGSIRWAVEHGRAGDPSYLLRPSSLDRFIPEAEAWERA